MQMRGTYEIKIMILIILIVVKAEQNIQYSGGGGYKTKSLVLDTFLL